MIYWKGNECNVRQIYALTHTLHLLLVLSSTRKETETQISSPSWLSCSGRTYVIVIIKAADCSVVESDG